MAYVVIHYISEFSSITDYDDSLRVIKFEEPQ